MQNPTSTGSQPGAQISLNAISEALTLFQNKAGVWIVISLVYLIIQIIGTVFNQIVSKNNPFLSLIVVLIIAVVNSILYAGIFSTALKQIKGQSIEIGDLFNAIDFAWPVFLASFFVGVLVAIGMMLCFLPGIVLAGLFIFTVPLVIDRKMGASDAISTSFATLKDQWLSAALFALVIGLIYILGMMCLYIGLLITMPIAILSITVAYRDFFLGQTPPAAGQKFQPAIPPGG